jgi:hypothetical protein
MSASQRRKGHNFEREVARRFREIMPGAQIERGAQAWGGGLDPDIRMPYFAPECKVGLRPNIGGAMVQAEERAKDRIPCVISRRNMGGNRAPQDLVTMRWEDFLEMFGEWWRCYGEGEWVSDETAEIVVDR